MALLAGIPAAAASQVPTPADHLRLPGRRRGGNSRTGTISPRTTRPSRAPATGSAVDTLGPHHAGDGPSSCSPSTSPGNHARLAELHGIQRQLGRPAHGGGGRGAGTPPGPGPHGGGWITHAIHSTEVGGAQSAAKLAHHLASSDDDKVREILDNVILLQIRRSTPTAPSG